MSQSPSAPTPEADQSRRAGTPILIDTDIGDDIDDAFALALALRSPELELHGVTTVFGDTRLRARLARHLLHIYGRDDIPVAAGESTPMLQYHRPSGAPQAAILDPREALPISAYSGPELIVRTAQAYAGQLTLVCIGPLTNVALAMRMEPRLYLAIRTIVMMGGTSGLPCPEWNVRSDARAAQVVLASGIPITMLGWNITRRSQLQPADVLRLLDCETPQARLLSRLLAVWQRHRPRWQSAYPYLHDPLTIAAICAPELLRFEEITARVLVDGPSVLHGVMVPRLLDGPLVRAAVGIWAEEAREWVMRRLLIEAQRRISVQGASDPSLRSG
jgi:inosine-uridine nucleoside N-ribohydrolase